MKKPAFIFLLSLLTLSASAQNHKKPQLAITNVNIVDVANSRIIAGMDVMIKGDRIDAVQPTNPDSVDAIFKVDGTGKYLIPGLWDMHAHPDDPEMWRMKPTEDSRDLLLPLFVLHGVTGIRDMAGSLKVVNSWKEKMANGSLLGPNIFAAGPLIDGPNPMWDGSVGIPSVQDVPRKVDSLKDVGVDFLKVYSLLPDSIYFALSKYANSIDFPFCGHVPQTITNRAASQSGISSLEHLLEIPLECSSEEEAIRSGNIDYGDAEGRLGRYLFRNKLIIDTYDPDKAAKLFETFTKNGTWHTPTVSMWFKNAWFEEEEQKDQQYFQYLPMYMRKYWSPRVNDHLRFREKNFVKLNQQLVEHYLRIIGDMHKAGVKLLAGTDTGANPLCWPGLGVHLELEMLEKAGLSPAEALKTATTNPVEYFGIEEEHGSVEEGKFADLVLLNKNPLESISNTQEISGVVRSGSFFTKGRINEYMEEIAERQ